MRLLIDARLYGLEHAGIGRYIKSLVDGLLNKFILTNQLILIVNSKYQNHFSSHPNLQLKITNIRHYTLKEQVLLPLIFKSINFDLLHVPHFNLPLLYSGQPHVLTVHDVLWHQVKGGNVTTLSPLIYHLKHFGYRLVVDQGVKKASAIIVPSEYVKTQLNRTVKLSHPNKIQVIHEGVAITSTQRVTSDSLPIASPFLLYLGSAYPHKNIPIIFKALKHFPELKLKIIGSRNIFLNKLAIKANIQGVGDQVEFLGYQSDHQIQSLFNQALALVHPSKSEGFGLTGLEAMANSCPVISSNSTCLPEIYGQGALFFPPDDADALIDIIKSLKSDIGLRREMIEKGLQQAHKYSWEKMLAQTIALYERTYLNPKT